VVGERYGWWEVIFLNKSPFYLYGVIGLITLIIAFVWTAIYYCFTKNCQKSEVTNISLDVRKSDINDLTSEEL